MNASKNGQVIIKPEVATTTQNNLVVSTTEMHLEKDQGEDDEVNDPEHLAQLKNGRIITTIIVVLFLVHPTITTTAFNAFK